MSGLRYGSVCSGIESATVAWHPLGWAPQFFSEIEPAPRAVLQHRWPGVPLHGDFTTIREGEYGPIDLLVGGTPCQDFSVAGLRGGLAGERGNLSLEFLRLAQRLRPRWLVWENVPGVLSSNGGRDFGAILGGMVELGYGFAYRVLDAQYVRIHGHGRAVPQRRRRVFVVGHLGDWRRPAAVLLERACLRGDPAPRREAGSGAAGDAASGIGGASSGAGRSAERRPATQAFGGGQNCNPTDMSTALSAHPGGRYDLQNETFIAFQQGGSNIGTTGSVANTLTKGNGNESGGVPCIAFSCKDYGADATDAGVSPTLRAMGHGASHPNAGGQMAIAFQERGRDGGRTLEIGGDVAFALTAPSGGGRGQERNILQGWAVRRLTPTECERLQGFPDGHTLVPWRGGLMPDGPRYKMLGNSKAVNVVRWIGTRITQIEALGLPPLRDAAA